MPLVETVDPDTLTPVQARTMGELRDVTRPQWERGDIEGWCNDLARAVLDLDLDREVKVTKHDLTVGCEVRTAVENRYSRFRWSPSNASGTLTHAAVGAWLHHPKPMSPGRAVELGLARARRTESGLGRWLEREITDDDLVELVEITTRRTAAWLDTMPPIPSGWSPVVENAVTATVGPVTLPAKYDLSLGAAKGMTAGRVVVEWKTGRPRPEHLTAARHYAAVETLAVGVPPAAVAVHYLDERRLVVEEVTMDTLLAAGRAVVTAAARVDRLNRLDRLSTGPGVLCKWCPVVTGCRTGSGFLAAGGDWEPQVGQIDPSTIHADGDAAAISVALR